MKKLKHKSRKILGLLLAGIMCISVVPMPTVQAENDESRAKELSISGNDASGSVSGNEKTPEEELVEIYEMDNYRIKYAITSLWTGGYNVNISIENTGECVNNNWYLRFPLSEDIHDLWNGEIVNQEEGVYVIKNAGYNQDIAVGNTINLGFSVEGAFEGFP